MIDVVILKDDESRRMGFHISGHSGLAEPGEDILCAAVSMMAYTTINSIIKIVGIDPSKLDIVEEDGFLSLSLKKGPWSLKEIHETGLLLRSMELGMIELLRQYSESIAVYFREVTSCCV